jgi:protein-S-isoprenylcysteine O-methyltransferase Ste14
VPQHASVAGMRLSRLVFVTVIGAGILSAAAGLEEWSVRCAYAAAYTGVLAFHLPAVAAGSLDAGQRRGWTSRAARERDVRLLALTGFGGPMATLGVAALDRRLGWSPDTCTALRLLALAVMAMGYVLFARAKASNKSYVGGLRAQAARCPAITTRGPYRVVRHPGYLGLILCSLATPPLLGSQWALMPAIFTVAGVIAMTALEDRSLQRELVGYREYARQVHFRLLPGLW